MPLPRYAAMKAKGGLGRRGKFKHVESDAMGGVNSGRRWSVVALKKRRDSRVDAVLELRPSPPPARNAPRRREGLKGREGREGMAAKKRPQGRRVEERALARA